MKIKVINFLVAFTAISIIGLFQWEILPSALQSEPGGYASGALTMVQNDVQADDVGTKGQIELRGRYGESPNLETPSALDPVTIILLGSGLIGLAGLGRKKL